MLVIIYTKRKVPGRNRRPIKQATNFFPTHFALSPKDQSNRTMHNTEPAAGLGSPWTDPIPIASSAMAMISLFSLSFLLGSSWRLYLNRHTNAHITVNLSMVDHLTDCVDGINSSIVVSFALFCLGFVKRHFLCISSEWWWLMVKLNSTQKYHFLI